ncbi:DNA-processing protein DprA [Synechococcus sp. UW179A]|uniref:DNA-processing protein DprA n=1 Tax=Synechococcus sp. UW179A TaxID=2575510 RepID=UPI000E0FB71D|nr:DNA-protecting protein DprA [Synechococcus sp. UW179A]
MRQLCSAAANAPQGFQELWSCSLPTLQKQFGWPAAVMSSLERYRSSLGLKPCIKVPINVLLPCDPEWPACFERLERPPLSIHWRGSQDLLSLLSMQQAVAVVGTRRPSSHGLRMADNLGRALAQAHWPVVSGLAEGVDAAAHRACLEAGGCPVAVLGTPLHRVYPPEHRRLQQEVARAGLLITELRDSERVLRSSFALRNRLLVAVAKAVVVVECPENSGALHTAAVARSLGIPVWVVPGDALRESSQGSNALLQSGALPLIKAQALIHHLGPGPCGSCLEESHASALKSNKLLRISSVQTRLLKLVDDDSSFDEMVHALQSKPERVAAELLKLELDGLVVAQPGLRWRSL